MSLRPALFTPFVLLLGCSEPQYGTTPETAFSVDVTCSQRDCGTSYDECTAETSEVCSLCYQSCAYGPCVCGSLCDDSHCNYYCSESDPCIDANAEASVGEQDPRIAQACLRWVDRSVSCGEEGPTPNQCATFAATEKPIAADAYDCLADTPCGETPDCDLIAPDTELAALTCARVQECIAEPYEACNDSRLAEFLGWLRHDAVSSLEGCLALSDCVERLECYDAFLTTIFDE